MKFSTFVTVWATFLGVSQAVLDNLPTFNGGTVPWIDKLKDTTPPNHFINKRAYGTAPVHCVNLAVKNSYCSPYKLEVFDIYYADCHSPWVICRCTDTPAAYSIDVIANNIGKVPVRARSWVRHYTFFPATSAYAAFSSSNDINVFGEWSTSTILLHEGGHNLDYWVGGNSLGWYSSSAAWQDQGSQDTCVATAYSKSSWAEHFAEMSVQATYEENIGPIAVDTTCMAHSLTTSRALLRSAIKVVSGDICIDRISPAPSICMGPDARAQGLCNDVPDTASSSAAVSAKIAKEPVFIRLEKDQREFDAMLAKRYPEALGKFSMKTFIA